MSDSPDYFSNRRSSSSYNARRISAHRSTPSASYGPLRRSFSREPIRPNPYSLPLAMTAPEPLVLRREYNDREPGTKLYISNLDYDVSDRDIGILFSGVGELERYSVHYDKSGRSKGTAEVVFAHPQDALVSIKKYNNAILDGKPMKIELIGADVLLPSTRAPASGSSGRPYGFARSDQESYVGRDQVSYYPLGRERYVDRGRGHGDGGFGRGQEQVRSRGEKVTAEELDADLERYRSQAKKKK